jgi:LacI family transcriptional regulator
MDANKNITIKDIAKKANVSIATVSNVLNNKGRVSEETRKRVKDIIDKYNYTPNLTARSLKNKNSHLISVIVPYLHKGELEDNPYYWQVISGIESGARNENFHVMLTGISKDENLSFVNERHLDGIIVIGINENTKLFNKIVELNIPCVFMDSYLTGTDLYQVYNNDKLGGYLGTKHLITLGYKKIILISGIKGKIEEKSGVDYQRWLGYHQALKEAGIPYNPDLVFEEGQTMVGGYYAAQNIFNLIDENTAIFVLSDIGAMGLIRGLTELGVSVPDDVSVMGYDDIFYTSYMTPSLTTIRQDIFKKGKTVASLLLNQINHNELSMERKVVLPVELKIRESTVKRVHKF